MTIKRHSPFDTPIGVERQRYRKDRIKKASRRNRIRKHVRTRTGRRRR